MYLIKRHRLLFFVACLCSLVAVWCLWYVFTRMQTSTDFRQAIKEHDFQKAQEAWEAGVWISESDPLWQFMTMKDQLELQPGVRVTSWRLGKLAPLSNENRFFALLDIEDSQGENAKFGCALEWERDKWNLTTKSAPLPRYLTNIFGVRW